MLVMLNVTPDAKFSFLEGLTASFSGGPDILSQEFLYDKEEICLRIDAFLANQGKLSKEIKKDALQLKKLS